MRRLGALCVWFGLASFASGVFAEEAPKTSVAHLICGPASLVARTTSVAHVGPENGLVWTTQNITLQNGASGPVRAISLEGLDAGVTAAAPRGLPAIVSSWTCLHGAAGGVILLWYACNRNDKGGACEGEREWERLFDTNGQRLDAGYAHQDARYGALSKKLGIPAGDIQLEDAIGD